MRKDEATNPGSRDLEAAVIAQARRGDEAAWEEIVRRLGPPVRGFARARGVPDPEDVTQEVFLGAARGLESFSGDWDRFRAWVFTIAYRRVVDHYRRRSRELPSEILPEQASADPGPEELAAERSEAAEALSALDVLGDVERDVVLLRVIGELDTEAVARAVGKRPGNVRVIQTRALQKLRAELERRGAMVPDVTVGRSER